MVKQIKDGETALSEKKIQISHSEEVSGQMTADLHDAEGILKVTTEKLEEIQAQRDLKMRDYKSWMSKHSDELLAIREAATILTGEVAKRFSSKQTVGTPGEAASFLQLSRSQRRTAISLFQVAKTPGIALLALRAQTHLMSHERERTDPFAKVKRMIQQMLEKLLQEQAEEADHKAWCDREMGKSMESKEQKEHEVQKLKDRLDAMDAELVQVSDEVETITIALSEMASSLVEAAKVRRKESARNTVAIKDYQEAAKLVLNAITVLKEFYAQDEAPKALLEIPAAAPAGAGSAPDASNPDFSYETKSAAATGIIGILEIAVQDFNDSEKETTQMEAVAQKDFEDFQHEANVKRAVFVRDLEYNNRKKVQLQGDRTRLLADLEGYEKELAAVNDYLEKLKPSCVSAVASYEERARRREQELQALQEALQVLEGEAIA